MNAASLGLRYDQAEDRLILIASGLTAERVALAMTRRLGRTLIGKMIELLMNSSPEVSRAAVQHRDDVLLFEHVTAVAAGVGGTPSASGAQPGSTMSSAQDVAPTLLCRVDLTPTAERLVMRFFDADGPRFDLVLDRAQLHQLLGIMAGKAREASWDFGELGWIDRGMHVVVPKGISVC